MKEIDVGKEFYYRLANRNKHQGDGKHTAVDFRKGFLAPIDNKKAWESDQTLLILNFKNVNKIGPSFANEAFAYFMKYTTPENFKRKVQFKDITKIQEMIIDTELRSGYSK